MLIVEIPECPLPQDLRDLRNLKEYTRIHLSPEGLPDHPHKLKRFSDMLQRHLAAYQVCMNIRIPFRIEFFDERHPLFRRAGRSRFIIDGIEAYTPVVPNLAQQCEKLAFAASDLKDHLVTQMKPFHQPHGKISMKPGKSRGKPLRLFVAR